MHTRILRPCPGRWVVALAVVLLGARSFVEELEAQIPPPDSVLTLDAIAVVIRREFGLIGGASAMAFTLQKMNLPPIATAEDALRDIPLVTVRQNSRGQAELSIRGSESRQVAVLIDGVPLTLAWDSRADPSVIPILGAERIDVVRGLSTLLTGPNVLGGVVDISLGRRTGDADPQASARWTSGLDQEGGYALGGSVGQPIESSGGMWMVRGGGGWRSRPGVPLPGDIEDPSGEDGRRGNSFIDQVNGFAAVSYNRDDGRWLSFSASGQSSDRGVPPELHVQDPRLWQYPEDWSGFASASAGTGEVATPWGTGEFELNLGVQGGRQEISSFESLAFQSIEGSEVGEDRTLSARLSGGHSLGADHRLETALTLAQVNHTETLGSDAPSDFGQRLWSLAAETNWDVGTTSRLSVSGALDGATTTDAGGRERLGAKWAPAGRVGLTVPLATRPIALHASLSSRARFPSLRELYSGALGRFEPNPGLDPERMLALEGGATFGRRGGDVQLVGFHHRLSDAVVRTTTPEGKFKRVNQNQLESTGLELLLGYQSGEFEVDAEMTIQSVSLEAPTGAVQPEHVPEFQAGFDFEVPFEEDFLARARVEYRGEMFCIHPEFQTEIRLGGSGRADVAVERTFQLRSAGRLSSVRARASLDNAFDGAHYDQCGMPQPGRTLSFGVELF